MNIPSSQYLDPYFLVNGKVSDKPLQSNERNIFIAIMGMTGAGKSTFISHCTDAKVAISEPGALQSCTQEVQVYRCKSFTSHANVYLVDTPGFDDTNRKDTDILKEIATWLTTTYKKGIRLRGILYLHRISDNRMGGCAHRNLIMFKKLCGPEGIKSVIFLTTFWEKIDATDGDNREKTLKTTDEFWGYFVERGARVQRHWNTENSAMAAIQNFVPSDIPEPSEEIKLAIQTEMVDSQKDLDQTSAGQELQSELQKERDKMQNEFNERAREIKEQKDQEMRDILQKDQERQARELRRRESEIQDLKISMERMHEKKIQELEERLLEQQNEARRHSEEAEQIIQQLKSQMEKQQIRYSKVDQKANDKEEKEKEKMFRQAADGQKIALGPIHEDTLDSIHRLGRSLYNQKKYTDADEMFQKAAEGRNITLGPIHEHTLDSIQWLGCSLYDQGKYKAAEDMFRKAADGQEIILGPLNEDTLDSIQWLGRSICDQEKFDAAEDMFRKAAEWREITLGPTHEDTLDSIGWLGCSMYYQKKYTAAESMFQKRYQGQQQILGDTHAATRNSKSWMKNAERMRCHSY